MWQHWRFVVTCARFNALAYLFHDVLKKNNTIEDYAVSVRWTIDLILPYTTYFLGDLYKLTKLLFIFSSSAHISVNKRILDNVFDIKS